MSITYPTTVATPYADEYRDGHTCLIVAVDNKTMANPCDR